MLFQKQHFQKTENGLSCQLPLLFLKEDCGSKNTVLLEKWSKEMKRKKFLPVFFQEIIWSL